MRAKQRVLDLIANSAEERGDWVEAINEAVDQQAALRGEWCGDCFSNGTHFIEICAYLNLLGQNFRVLHFLFYHTHHSLFLPHRDATEEDPHRGVLTTERWTYRRPCSCVGEG